jgi:hypothetical protein
MSCAPVTLFLAERAPDLAVIELAHSTATVALAGRGRGARAVGFERYSGLGVHGALLPSVQEACGVRELQHPSGGNDRAIEIAVVNRKER